MYRLGVRETIADALDGPSEANQICAAFYEDTRDSLLRSANWPFATRRYIPGAALAYTRSGWSNAYLLPDDLIRVQYIWPGGTNQVGFTLPPDLARLGIWQNPRTPRKDQRIPYAIEADTAPSDAQILLTDLGPSAGHSPEIVYTSRILDISKYDPLFSDALTWALADDMAMALTISPERHKLVKAGASEALKLALAICYNEEEEDIVPDAEAITARL
jgi:hypothetical protein